MASPLFSMPLGETARFRVYVMGRFRLERDGAEVRVAPGHCMTVMQRLALNGGMIHRERLMEELWPEVRLVDGGPRLRNVLARLRRQTDASLDARGATVRLLDTYWCDLDEFIRLATRALSPEVPPQRARELALEAHGLWGGAPLEAQRYRPWADALRRRAHHLQTQMWRLLEDPIQGPWAPPASDY